MEPLELKEIKPNSKLQSIVFLNEFPNFGGFTIPTFIINFNKSQFHTDT